MFLEIQMHIVGLRAMYKVAFELPLSSAPCESIMQLNVSGLQQRSVPNQ